MMLRPDNNNINKTDMYTGHISGRIKYLYKGNKLLEYRHTDCQSTVCLGTT